uniref:Putative death ligand signal enhancer n=1 Tax=Amblyomma sculptum TaxID=1581419 RepID=A0A1E1XLX5_AMBSC
MWRSNFRGFARWRLRKQCKPKSEDSPDKQDTQRFIVPAANLGANRQRQYERRERETCHDDGRFYTSRPTCSFMETVGWVGTLIAVGLNVQLHSRRCLWGSDKAGRTIAGIDGTLEDKQRCLSLCHIIRSFVFRLVVSSPLPASARSILPREQQTWSKSAELSADGVYSFEEEPPEPSSPAEASEQLANVMREYFACLEDIKGAELLSTNEKKALESFKRAKMLGSARAYYNLGVCYETGKGVGRDLDKAVMHYKEASLRGHPQATYNLGVLYLNGYEKGSTDSGRELLEKASALGIPQAKTFVAHRHLEEGNYADALPLLKDAAAAKDPDALFYLGLCCEKGLAVPQDQGAAAEYYARAACQNHVGALGALATINKATDPRVQMEPVCNTEPSQDLSPMNHSGGLRVSRYLTALLPSLLSGKQEPTVHVYLREDDYIAACSPHKDTSCGDPSQKVCAL